MYENRTCTKSLFLAVIMPKRHTCGFIHMPIQGGQGVEGYGTHDGDGHGTQRLLPRGGCRHVWHQPGHLLQVRDKCFTSKGVDTFFDDWFSSGYIRDISIRWEQVLTNQSTSDEDTCWDIYLKWGHMLRHLRVWTRVNKSAFNEATS